MPSDLVIDVRQVSSYPNLPASNGTETLLLQQGGLGGPYASISTEMLVSTALNSSSLGVGTPVPAGASSGNVFANPYVLPLPQASILWNAYDAGGLKYVAAGMMAALNFDQAKGFDFVLAPVGSPNAAVSGDQSILQLTNAGNLNLPFGTMSVARDPAALNEVATMGWVGKSTVSSFNNRNGQVQLNADDVYAALRLCDPIATQPWVQNAINQSIQNLLVTCPFVNRWNNRTGSVYLMLSDITTVFYQPGQQPIAPTPPAASSDDSIANTKWVTDLVAPLAVGGSLSVVNVLNYGARGDGVTDDTTAIQNVLNAYAGKATVLIPNTGSPYITRGMTLPSYTELIINGTLMLQTGGSVFVQNQNNVTIRGNGTIDCAATATGNSGGINVQNASSVRISGVTIQNAKLWNFAADNSTHVIVDGVTLLGGEYSNGFNQGCSDCWLLNSVIDGVLADSGFAFYGGPKNCGAMGNTIRNIVLNYGIYVLSDSGQPAPSDSLIISHNIIHDNGYGGIAVDASVVAPWHTDIIISNNRVYGNNKQNIALVNDVFVDHVTGVIISDNLISSNDGGVVYATSTGIGTGSNAVDVTITGNSVYDIGRSGQAGTGIRVTSSIVVHVGSNTIHDFRSPAFMTNAIAGTAGAVNVYTNNMFGNLAGAALQIVSQPDTFIGNAIDGCWTTTVPADAADDAAAAAAGVPVGGRYRNGSVMMVRVA